MPSQEIGRRADIQIWLRYAGMGTAYGLGGYISRRYWHREAVFVAHDLFAEDARTSSLRWKCRFMKTLTFPVTVSLVPVRAGLSACASTRQVSSRGPWRRWLLPLQRLADSAVAFALRADCCK
jgi:hypothetical protein